MDLKTLAVMIVTHWLTLTIGMVLGAAWNRTFIGQVDDGQDNK